MTLPSRSRREFLRLGGRLFAGAALLAACASPLARERPVRGGHLVESRMSDISGLNPILFPDPASLSLSQLLFDGLLTSASRGEVFPALAQSLPTVSADGRSYSFRLRSDARWSDGAPVTSADVAYTLSLFDDPGYTESPTELGIRPLGSDVSALVGDLSTPDDRTVVFRLRRPWAPFAATLCQYGLLPQHVLGRLRPGEVAGDSFSRAPSVVSGPFKFVVWDRHQTVVLARNEDYYRGPANLERLVRQVEPDVYALTNQILAGTVDLAVLPEPVTTRFPNDYLFHQVEASFILCLYQLDPARAAARLFQDRRVRQALLHAVDRQAVIDSIFQKRDAGIADSLLSPTSWGFNPNVIYRYPFDPRRAELLLDAAGWRRGSAGTRARDGVSLSFQISIPSIGDNLEPLAGQMVAYWRKVGVEATVRRRPDFVRVCRQTRDFDVVLATLRQPPDPDQSWLWHSRSAAPGGLNASGYRNQVVDQMLDQAVATSDRFERKKTYFHLQDVLAQDLPAAPLFFANSTTALNHRVHQAIVDPPSTVATRPWLRDAYVEDGR